MVSIVSIWFILSINIPVFSQQKSTISFYVQNETLRSVLDRLISEHNINITYNASNTAFDKKISFQSNNKTPMEILRGILTQNGHEYHYSGNHLVILKSPEYILNSKVEQGVKEMQIIREPVLDNSVEESVDVAMNDLVLPEVIRDTIFIRDTLVLTITEVIVDTVYIERLQQSVTTRPESFIRDFLGLETNNRERWAAGVSYAQMLSGFDFLAINDLTPELQRVINAEPLSLRNFNIGISLHYLAGNFSMGAHVGIQSFSHRFTWSDLSISGGFDRIDTLDSFFTLTANDTLWTHITDTTWIPLDRQEVIYDKMNRLGFLEAGISARYILVTGRNIAWFARMGFAINTPLWLNAQSIINEDGFRAQNSSRSDVNTWIFAWDAGLGINARINPVSDLFIESTYRRYVNEWNTNHPLERRMHGAGIRLGVLYYF